PAEVGSARLPPALRSVAKPTAPAPGAGATRSPRAAPPVAPAPTTTATSPGGPTASGNPPQHEYSQQQIRQQRPQRCHRDGGETLVNLRVLDRLDLGL